MAAKAARKKPNVQHLVHGTNMLDVGKILRRAAKAEDIDSLSNQQLLNLVANAMTQVGKETRSKR